MLGVCREAGLVRLGLVVLDGTKVKATRRFVGLQHPLAVYDALLAPVAMA